MYHWPSDVERPAGEQRRDNLARQVQHRHRRRRRRRQRRIRRRLILRLLPPLLPDLPKTWNMEAYHENIRVDNWKIIFAARFHNNLFSVLCHVIQHSFKNNNGTKIPGKKLL
jgi:hypothetical protein